MAGYFERDGSYVKGIEDFLLERGAIPTEEHQKWWLRISPITGFISHDYKFHGIFATSSIRGGGGATNASKKRLRSESHRPSTPASTIMAPVSIKKRPCRKLYQITIALRASFTFHIRQMKKIFRPAGA